MTRLLPVKCLFVLAGGLAAVVTAAADDPSAAAQSAEPGFEAIFNGKNLAGWEGNTDLWKVRDGMIVGDSPGIRRNEFMAPERG